MGCKLNMYIFIGSCSMYLAQCLDLERFWGLNLFDKYRHCDSLLETQVRNFMYTFKREEDLQNS